MIKKEARREGCSMSLEANKVIVRKMIEDYNEANFDILENLVAPDYIG